MRVELARIVNDTVTSLHVYANERKDFVDPMFYISLSACACMREFVYLRTCETSERVGACR